MQHAQIPTTIPIEVPAIAPLPNELDVEFESLDRPLSPCLPCRVDETIRCVVSSIFPMLIVEL